MTSYTDATETASTGEGKRNRKTQALSALLSATALGVFLEGCASPAPAPAPVNDYERIDDNLYFPNANGINDFSFVRNGDDVEITAGVDSGTIEGFANNVLTLYYGSGKTELGKLYVGTENGDTPPEGDDGANVMIGLGGNDYLYGGAGDDYLYGGADNDNLYGGGGNDYLYGGAGNDFLYGNDGDDTLFAGAGGGSMEGNDGNDILHGGEGRDGIKGGAGIDILYGGAEVDDLIGGADDDELYGGAGNDFLYGNAGNDLLDGGAGGDYLYGGAGTDTYVFRVGDGEDIIDGSHSNGDVAGDTIILRFEGSSYGADDFTSAILDKNNNDLYITIDLDPDADGITNKITIYNAAAFTINIEYGEEGGTFTTVADIWSGIT